MVCGKNRHAMTLAVVHENNTHAMTLVDPYVVYEKTTLAMNSTRSIWFMKRTDMQ